MKKTVLINWDYFEKSNNFNEIEEKISFHRNEINDNIQFHLFGSIFNFEFGGIKIIQCNNTNKFLRNIFDEYMEPLISINGIRINSKNLFIISPMTKISDILNNKSSGDLCKYLKNCDNSSDIKKINNLLGEIYYQKDDCIKNVTEISLAKTDLINYLDIKDEFVNEKNIFDILTILKTNNIKKLIVFNDVDYLSIENTKRFSSNFDFLYLMNNYEKNWEFTKNYFFYSLIYENGKIFEYKIDNCEN